MSTLGEILHVADMAYESGAMQLTVDHPPGIRGDGLADFIANELRDVCEGLDWDDMPQVAINALETAIQELEAVRTAIEELT